MTRCAACGTELSVGARFCASCGAALLTPTSTPTRLDPDATPVGGAGDAVARVADAGAGTRGSSSGGAGGAAGPTRYAPGTVLAGRYRIVSFLGRGGMGEVYRADDLRLGEPVALKFLSRDLAADASMRARFDGEVRMARTVAHPNVCRVYDIGEADGRAFLTMEYVDGEDLASLLRRIGRLPGTKAVEIARQLAAGLGAAHARGVLHRDLKPANVMIDGRGHARLTDFGLAVLDAPGAGSDAAGTPAYMAPERSDGRPATVASDLYGLGLILYEVVTGAMPFEGDSPATWRNAHRSSVPPPPASRVPYIDPALERAILRCLEKDPARRPASAASFAAMLPGGDPLAAAVAAGETPSPELVAAAGQEGSLAPRAAAAWLLLALRSIGIVVFAKSRHSLFERVPQIPEPAVMRARAKEILKTLGHDAPVYDSTWSYSAADLSAQLRDIDPALAPAPTEIGTMRPSPITFSYRSSPQSLTPHAPGQVQRDDPPMQWSGDALVQIDADGRLVELSVLAPQYDEAPAGAPTDWSRLLVLADLSPESLREVEPRWSSMIGSTERKAWEGKVGKLDARIEAE